MLLPMQQRITWRRGIICVLQKLQLLLPLQSFQSGHMALAQLLWKAEISSDLLAKLAGSGQQKAELPPALKATHQPGLIFFLCDWHLHTSFPSFWPVPIAQLQHATRGSHTRLFPLQGPRVSTQAPWPAQTSCHSPAFITCSHSCISRKPTEAILQLIPQKSLNCLIISLTTHLTEGQQMTALLPACFNI